MSNPSGPEDAQPKNDASTASDGADAAETVAIPSAKPAVEPAAADEIPERRFTAPSGFDAGSTQVIETAPEPATEIFAVSQTPPNPATEPIAASNPVAPQHIPGRNEPPKPPKRRRSWGWVVAVVLVIAAIVAVAILGTVLLTRDENPAVSQEDLGAHHHQQIRHRDQEGRSGGAAQHHLRRVGAILVDARQEHRPVARGRGGPGLADARWRPRASRRRPRWCIWLAPNLPPIAPVINSDRRGAPERTGTTCRC